MGAVSVEGSDADARSSGPEEVRDPLGRVGDWQPVDRRWVTVRRIREWIDSLLLVAVAGANGFFAVRLLELSDACWLLPCALLLVGLGLQSQLWPAYAWRFQGMRRVAEGVEVHRGAFFRTVTTVPRWRVQHVDIAQGPIERRFGLARLVIHTAGTQRAVELAGLPETDAVRVRDALMQERLQDGG
jgi:membrane protein YdbS with pleckstrin-like domain